MGPAGGGRLRGTLVPIVRHLIELRLGQGSLGISCGSFASCPMACGSGVGTLGEEGGS